MTTSLVRVYAIAVSALVFFLAWAGVAARPWASAPPPDPRIDALDARQAALIARARELQTALGRAGSAAQARLVDAPPVTQTRSS